MPKLLASPTSPYTAKVRMAATYVGIAFETVPVDTAAEPATLLDANPLGKIPTWITDEGDAIFDSRVIIQYLDRRSGGKLFPADSDARTRAERLEALADGICDSAIAHIYERRFRPPELVHREWLDRQWGKVLRGLRFLDTSMPALDSRLSAGDIALRATLSYLDLRFAGQWESGSDALLDWRRRFDKQFPELAALY